MTDEPAETWAQRVRREKQEAQHAERTSTFTTHHTPADPDDPHYHRRATAYAQSALDRITTELAGHPEGDRNTHLNNVALRCYRWCQAGLLDTEDTTQALRNAAYQCGLDTHEIGQTLQSAWRGSVKYGPAWPELRDDPFSPQQSDLEFDPTTGEVVVDDTNGPASASEKVRQAFPTLDWHALFADQTEEEWILEPILPARRLIALYSAPKMGKSLLLLEIACAVASGRPALGVTPERPRNVLYVDFENDPKGDIRERLQAMGYGPDDLARLHYLSFPTMAGLDSERGGVELMAAVTEYQCEVVIVDTVSRAINGEENENDTWLSFYRHTGLKLKQAGVALVRLDHSGKDETKGQRGGSAKSGDVDAVWRLSRVQDETYRLDCEASRMQVTEKVLVLHREEFPLRHRVDAQGDRAAYFLLVDKAAADLEACQVPVDYGRDKAGQMLRAGGFTAKNGPLAAAIKRRREAAERAENLSPE